MVDRASPFKGLRPFDDVETDVEFFFGRDLDREIIVANLMASRLTVLYGETGVGKSSVLRAGVAHHLRASSRSAVRESGRPVVAVVVLDNWQDDPVHALSDMVAAGVRDALGHEVDLPIATDSLAHRLEAWTELLDGDLYVILDQAEEFFLYHDADEAGEQFIEQLADAVRLPGLRASFILSLREDSVAKLDRFRGQIPNVLANYLRLDYLDRESGRAAIVGPVERYNELPGGGPVVDIEPSLVDAVLDQVTAGRVELGRVGRGTVAESNGDGRIETPFLQLVMQRIWEHELGSGSRVLRRATLEELGGAEQIVRDHLDRALGSLSPSEKEVAASVFNHLVTPSGTKIAHSVSDLARYAGVQETELRTVLGTLAQQRIVRPVAAKDGGSRFEIYHDVLAEAVLDWRTAHETERRLQQERAAAVRRQWWLIGVIGIVVLLAVFAVFAVIQRERARGESRDAQARQLDASALALLGTDPELSLLLASKSARLSPGPTSEDAVRSALLASKLRAVFQVGVPVAAVAQRPGGRSLGAVGTDGTVRVWDVQSGDLLFQRDVGSSGGLSFTRRGTVIVHGDAGPPAETRLSGKVVCTYGAAPVADVAVAQDTVVLTSGELFQSGTCKRLTRVDRLPPGVFRVVASPNGARVAFVAQTAAAERRPSLPRAVVAALPAGRIVSRLRDPLGITSLAFDHNGSRVVTGGRDGVARVWNSSTGRLERELRGHLDDVSDVAIDPTGAVVVTGGGVDAQARVWDARTGMLQTVLSGHLNFVGAVDITPEAAFVVTASTDGTARTWTATARLGAVLAGHTDAVTDAFFTPGGAMVVTSSDDGTVRLWDAGTAPDLIKAHIAAPTPPSLRASTPDGNVEAQAAGATIRVTREHGETMVLRGHKDVITSIAFSPDSRRLVSASRDHDAILWDAETGRALRVIRAHSGPVFDARFSPDGRWIVTAGPTTAGLWHASNGALVGYLRGAPGPVVAAAFEDDSRTIATRSRDGTVSRYKCDICGTIPELLNLADARLRATGRTLTSEERELYFG